MKRGKAHAWLSSWQVPPLSLPNMLVIGGIMGVKKTAVFCSIIVMLSTIAGMIFGLIA